MRDYGYGLWFLVVLNSAIFVIFAFSFFHPKSGRDWRAMGAFSAFVVALFTEMYGFPLTIYLLSGWLGSRFPGLNLTHNGGHLWTDLIGWKGDPHLSPFHLASYVFIGGGFWLIAAAWRVLFSAQRSHTLATTGAYSYVRHPQYAGFLLVMIGLLLQWPTIPTLLMFPILVLVYRRLSISEERAVAHEFGEAWNEYASRTPGFVPLLGRIRQARREAKARSAHAIPRTGDAPQREPSDRMVETSGPAWKDNSRGNAPPVATDPLAAHANGQRRWDERSRT